jgi:hypothetical protein
MLLFESAHENAQSFTPELRVCSVGAAQFVASAEREPAPNHMDLVGEDQEQVDSLEEGVPQENVCPPAGSAEGRRRIRLVERESGAWRVI